MACWFWSCVVECAMFCFLSSLSIVVLSSLSPSSPFSSPSCFLISVSSLQCVPCSLPSVFSSRPCVFSPRAKMTRHTGRDENTPGPWWKRQTHLYTAFGVPVCTKNSFPWECVEMSMLWQPYYTDHHDLLSYVTIDWETVWGWHAQVEKCNQVSSCMISVKVVSPCSLTDAVRESSLLVFFLVCATRVM